MRKIRIGKIDYDIFAYNRDTCAIWMILVQQWCQRVQPYGDTIEINLHVDSIKEALESLDFKHRDKGSVFYEGPENAARGLLEFFERKRASIIIL